MTLPSSQLSLEHVLHLLQEVRQHGDNYQAKCPAHDDSTASLSVRLGSEGRILFRCFAGCTFASIATALGLAPKQLLPPRGAPARRIVSTYDYRDLAGTLRYQSVRYDPKSFTQRQPDGSGNWIWNMRGVQRIPYRLNELQGHARVYIVEGEKDVDALWRNGLPATTNVGGAGKWRASDSAVLRSIGVQQCVLIPDNDDPGRKHMLQVEHSLRGAGIAATRLELLELPIKGDVSDWFGSGRTIEQLEQLAGKRPYVVPPAAGGATVSAVPDDPFGAARWNLTDLGVAESFVHRFGAHVRFNHKHKEWLVWNCHHWHPDANEEIRRKAAEHIRLWQTEALSIRDLERKQVVASFVLRLEKSAALNAIVDISKSRLPCADAGDYWDDDPYLLGCPNGVVELKTGTLRAGHPDDRITLQTAVGFDADARCERWDRFLGEIFVDQPEIIPFIQRAVGYALTGDTHEQCFFMCVGHGANGKSTFLSTLSHVWGDYSYTTDTNVFASSASSRDSTPFDLAELAGRRLIMMSETKANSRMNEQSIKNFTGGELINAQKKFGHPFEFQPVGKLWMGVNHQPKVVDDSHGFWRRVCLIPFLRIFSGSGDNRHLRRELLLESPGILAWAVRGALAWCQDGLNPPLCVMNATDAYQEAENPILEFLNERTMADSSAEVSCNSTYLSYKDWAKEQGMSEKEILTRNAFGRLMSKRYERRSTMTHRLYVGLRVTVRPKDLFENQA